MADNVETMAYAGQTPWHGLGNPVSNDLSVEEMLVAAGLDWTVDKRPLYFPKADGTGALKRAHGAYGLVRSSDMATLSVVGENYKPIQNAEAMDFFHKFVEAGGMQMETAGSLKGGKFVWCLAKIGADFTLAGGDEMEGYLLLSSPHQIGFRFVAQFTPIRVVCWNTLNISLGAGLNGGKSAFRMTHSRKFDESAKKEAELTLGIVNEQFQTFHETAELLASRRVTEEETTAYFWEVIEEDQDLFEKEEKDDPRIIAKFQQALLEAPGAELPTAMNTAWGLLNSVTYVTDHVLGRERDTALASSWFGTNASLKRRALDKAVELAKAA